MSTTSISFTISLVMIALFVVAIIGFSINFGIDNDSVVKLNNDSEFSGYYSNARDNLSTFGSDSERTYSSLVNTTIAPGSDSPQSVAPFVITPGNILGIIKNTVNLPYKKIFGSDAGFGIFFTTFIGFLVIVFGLLAYKALRGNP